MFEVTARQYRTAAVFHSRQILHRFGSSNSNLPASCPFILAMPLKVWPSVSSWPF